MNEKNSERYLSEEDRNKYINKLSEDRDTRIFAVQFMIIFVLFALFWVFISALVTPGGWLTLIWFAIGFVISLIVADALQARTKTKRILRANSDEILEARYKGKMEKERLSSEMKGKIKMPPGTVSAIMKMVLIGFAVLVVLSIPRDELIDTLKMLPSDARCSVDSMEASGGVILSGGLDAVVNVSALIKNTGKDGEVFVRTRVISSEGELDRTQKLYMGAGTSKNLKYQFQEVTADVKEFEYFVKCYPKLID